MALIVADASVVVKWLVPEREDEGDLDRALDLLNQLRSGQVHLLQPPHWLAEVAAVAVRLSLPMAERKVAALYALNVPVFDSKSVFLRACRLSRDLDHHLFDTLYHAVALESDDSLLVTADEQYYRKAQRHGRIVRLRDYDGG